MLGMFTGEFLRADSPKLSGSRKALWMALAAVALALIGWAWSFVMPVNKMLWSSSFTCVVAAYSLGMFALFYYVIDISGCRRWTLFFRVLGLHSITIALAQQIIPLRYASDFFVGGVASKCGEALGAVIYDAGYVTVCWLFLYFLYRKKTFLQV